jgi:ATP-binding cassette subfamily B protein
MNKLLFIQKKIWPYLSYKNKLTFFTIILLIILQSILELLNILAAVPFLTALAGGSVNKKYNSIFLNIDLTSLTDKEFFTYSAIIFGLFVLITGALRLIVMWIQIRFSQALGGYFSSKIFSNTLSKPYAFHLNKNSSEIISGITDKSYALINNLISPVINIINSLFVLIFITSALIFINIEVAILLFCSFGALYLSITFFINNFIKVAGSLINKDSVRVIKILQEALGGIRDVIIDRSQNVFIAEFNKSQLRLRKALADMQLITLSPRYILEILGLIIIVIGMMIVG